MQKKKRGNELRSYVLSMDVGCLIFGFMTLFFCCLGGMAVSAQPPAYNFAVIAFTGALFLCLSVAMIQWKAQTVRRAMKLVGDEESVQRMVQRNGSPFEALVWGANSADQILQVVEDNDLVVYSKGTLPFVIVGAKRKTTG